MTKIKYSVVLTSMIIVLLSNQFSRGELIVGEGDTYVLDHQEGHCIVPHGSTLIVEDGGYADLADFWSGSKLIMNGGFLSGVVTTEGFTAEIYGGEVHRLDGQGVLEITGGHIGEATCDGYNYIKGGSISDLDVGPSSQAWITGGSIDYVEVDRSEVYIFSAGVNNLWFWPAGGKAHIYADKFKLDGIDIGYGTYEQFSGSHTLEYSLSNGTVGKTDIYVEYGSASSISLIPEPASAAIVAMGAALIASRRKWH